MFYGLIAFSIHFIIYWVMVVLYDDVYNIEACKNSLKNQFILTLPLSILFFNYYPIEYNNIFISFACIPFIIVTSDIYFYLSHRPMHTKLLYKYHKHHHTGEVCVAKALDADGIEHIIGNLGSFISGILLLWYFGFIINIYIFTTWVGLVTINTCVSHNKNPPITDKGLHLNHHKYRNCNYGFGFYIMDRMMGTYKIEYGPELLLEKSESKGQDIQSWTQIMQTFIESVIRENPTPWMCGHRRWKTRPPEEKKIY